MEVPGDKGIGQTPDVIRGIDWVITNRNNYQIRVAHISLGDPVYEPAARNPLVQAVERAWNAGIVVVCSAGNDGRLGYGTIISPGYSPKVITVGSIADRGATDRNTTTGMMGFDNTGITSGNQSWSDAVLWSDAALWSD